MTSVATAKLLFFIALTASPQGAPTTILATSNSDNYAWMQTRDGWCLETKGLPANDWEGQGAQSTSQPTQGHEYRAIARHHWSDGSSMDLWDGSRIEKAHGAVFYIESPGAPNQKVYTILYSTGCP